MNKTWHGVPVWTWILGAGAVGYIGYKYYKSKSAATAAQTAAALQASGAGAGSAAGTQASYNPASDIAAGFDALMNQLATMNPPASSAGKTTSSPQGLTQQQLLNIGNAEIANETAAAGGNVLQGFKNMGFTQQQVQQLSQAASAPGGATFLTENMAAKQAGLPYYNSAGQLVG